MSNWRLASRRTIEEVVAEHGGLPEKDLRKKISDAYPFGERAMWPYKVWLSEVKAYFGYDYSSAEQIELPMESLKQ